jgi:hypothetical protein
MKQQWSRQVYGVAVHKVQQGRADQQAKVSGWDGVVGASRRRLCTALHCIFAYAQPIHGNLDVHFLLSWHLVRPVVCGYMVTCEMY